METQRWHISHGIWPFRSSGARSHSWSDLWWAAAVRYFSLCVSWLMFLLEDFQTDGSRGCLWSCAVSRFSPLEDYLKSLRKPARFYTAGPGGGVRTSAARSCVWWLMVYRVCVHDDIPALSMSSVTQHFYLEQLHIACWVQTHCGRKRPNWAPVGGPIHVWCIFNDKSSYSAFWESDDATVTIGRKERRQEYNEWADLF